MGTWTALPSFVVHADQWSSIISHSFSCGTYVSLVAVPAMTMGAIGDVGRRTGLFLSIAAFGALAGPPISGAINSATGGFEDVGWYAGKRPEFLFLSYPKHTTSFKVESCCSRCACCC